MDAQVIRAPDTLTVRSVTAYAEELRTKLEGASKVLLDLSQSAELDLSAIQLIVAARTQAARAITSFGLAQPAKGVLLNLLERAGFLADPSSADIDFWFHGERPQ